MVETCMYQPTIFIFRYNVLENNLNHITLVRYLQEKSTAKNMFENCGTHEYKKLRPSIFEIKAIICH